MYKLLALIPLLLLILAGCAGNGTSTTKSPYAGSYKGSTTLDGGKKGELAYTIAEDGSVTGTLTVSAPAATKGQDFNFTFGTMTIEGHIDDDGTITLTGTDPNSGGFTITGKVNPDGSATLTITAGGSTFTVNITSTGGGGGSGSITFSDGSGTNANLAAWPSNPFILMSSVADNISLVTTPSPTDNTRSFVINVNANLSAGSTYTFSKDNTDAAMVYGEGDNHWLATSGQMKIITKTATNFEAEFINVGFEPDIDPASSATGTFKINGSLKK